MGGWSGRVMGQKGFFDVERRLEAISAKGDPLETIKKMVRGEDFRAAIEAVTEMKPEERKTTPGSTSGPRSLRREATGDMIVVRYADDFIVGFQHEDGARRF